MKKILSSVLVLAILMSSFVGLAVTSSADEEETFAVEIVKGDHLSHTQAAEKQQYYSAQDKLDSDPDMMLMVKKNHLSLYCNPYTGEVYVKDSITGQVTGTNPYSLKGITTPGPYLSQLFINYGSVKDAGSGASGSMYNTFTDAAVRGQITVTPIRGGIRVNYTIGDTTKRYAVPYGMMADKFIETIVTPIQSVLVEEFLRLAEFQVGYKPSFQDEIGRFDYEAFCAERGIDYVWGNQDAFKSWFTGLLNWYRSDSGATFTQYLEMLQLSTEYTSLMTVYSLKDPANEKTPNLLNDMLEKYPILQEKNDDGTYKNSIYVLDEGLANAKLNTFQSIIQKYVNGYTLDSMYEDEDITGVHGPEVTNPVFHVALEYLLTDDGFTVTMPADSLVYDESKYVVNYIDLLPYMGAGRVAEGGYVFYPDGSGAIIDFDDFINTNAILSAAVFGNDHAFYNVTGKHQESISIPVYGTVEEEQVYTFRDPYEDRNVYCGNEEYVNGGYTFTYQKTPEGFVTTYPNGSTRVVDHFYRRNGQKATLTDANYQTASTLVTDIAVSEFQNGVLTILEDGASMTEIHASLQMAASNPYSSVYARLLPHPKDKYNLADSMTAFDNAEFTVFADVKYMGDYVAQVVMLPDPDIATVIDGYYPATYAGMAGAYREHLYETGVLSTITTLEENLPLYIESFGVIETTERFLSIPVTVDKALTTFEDVETMYQELCDKGISNIKFRLTGFANGGMYSTYPAKVKWEKAAGGKDGYRDLLSFVSENADKGMEVFPNFNFSYVEMTGTFDGISLKKIGARSLDNRYAIRKTYSSVYQVFTRLGGIAVSTDRMYDLFEKFHTKNSVYHNHSISLDYLGSDLSSNFSDKNLVIREDALDNVKELLQKAQNVGYLSIMTTGGNAYALSHVNHLLNAPIDSSRYMATSYTVPFWGMVMHGSLQYAGTTFNEEANKADAILRAIESGASLYFTLSYANVQLLKEDELLSDYYAVDYENSKNTVIKYYNILNDAIGDLQNYYIVDHKSIGAERVITEAEQIKNRLTLQNEFLSELRAYVNLGLVEKRATIVALRNLVGDIVESRGEIPADYAGLGMILQDRVANFLSTYSADTDIAKVIKGGQDDVEQINLFLNALHNGTLPYEGEVDVSVRLNRASVLKEAAKQLYVDTPDELDSEFVAAIDAYIASLKSKSASWNVTTGNFTYESAYNYLTLSGALDKDYDTTNYTIDNGSVTMVVYQYHGHSVRFILNHNMFSVNVNIDGEIKTLEKYAFIRLDQ